MQIFSIRVQTLSEKVFISPEVLKSLWAMCAFAAGLVFVAGEVFNYKSRNFFLSSHFSIQIFMCQKVQQ